MKKTIASLKAADLRQLGVSKPYAHQLVSRDRAPSLELAVRIERAFGIAPREWLEAANDTSAQERAA